MYLRINYFYTITQMKKTLLLPFVFFGLIIFLSGSSSPKDNEYIIIGWNDLGMHCANKDFSKIVILPPYNNFTAHLIKRGTATSLPQIITDGFHVEYSIPGNTYSVGKTNFWSYEDQIFGVNLPDNIGLTGKGLTGQMDIESNFFKAIGVPLTPFTDANTITEDPFQMALLNAYDGQNNLIATTQNVMPVSNEINCVSSGCHSSENDILYEHEDEGGFDPTNTPILCAGCHGSNALGIPGTPGLGSVSFVIHDKHKDKTNDCYKCHPGPNTQCFRDVMHAAGMVCQDCHGSVAQVASSIENGREPWLEEPQCGATACHGATYAENSGKLFRQSKGHADLFCSNCHGSPHAIVPSTLDRDNLQNISLQGYAGILNRCLVCHEVDPQGTGPHGMPFTNIEVVSLEKSGNLELMENFPNPFSVKTTIPFKLSDTGKVGLEVIDSNGKIVKTLIKQRMIPGEYKVDFSSENLGAGIYFARLSLNGESAMKKIILAN